jgi:acetyl esterase
MLHGFANILALSGETRAARLRISTAIRAALNPS